VKWCHRIPAGRVAIGFSIADLQEACARVDSNANAPGIMNRKLEFGQGKFSNAGMRVSESVVTRQPHLLHLLDRQIALVPNPCWATREQVQRKLESWSPRDRDTRAHKPAQPNRPDCQDAS
jgi:hypothetical protein